ncbi:uncharacterized protein [Dermacentor albipictus]|uniref:uncharacterized protein n=1 Tax=Dermacentor albipictus TaxID=60249 RepID=UPI0038FD2C2A
MDPGGYGRTANDNSEDDCDPNTPGQERQLTHEDGTLTVFFPVPHTVRCCEEGCRAAYAAAKWTAWRQSLQRHLELEHGARIQRTINVCRQRQHPPTEQDSTEGPAEDPPETPAVAIEQAAHQEPSPVAPRGTPGHSSDGEMAEAPSPRTPNQSGRTATSATPSPTPSLPSNRGSPGVPVSEAHEPAAMQELSPGRAEVQDHDGSTLDFRTQEEHAGTTRPEGSAWDLEDETAELRALSRLPESAGEWALFENILDRAIAAATKHLRLRVAYSRQLEMREVNPDNPQQIQTLYERNRRRAVRLITEGPSQLCPIDPNAMQDHYSNLWSPTTVDTSILWSRLPATEELDLCPFSPEVAAKLRKCESTAPGEDRLTYHHRRQVDPEGRFLVAVYNVCLQYSRTPLSWTSTRTIVIHKKGDHEDLTNWRPMGLGRTIAKLYAGCLTTRLQRLFCDHAVLSRCQKGFLLHDGLFEYTVVLQGRLDDARTGGGELCMGFLDFANAFSSVTHEALVDAVRGAVQGGDRQHNILAYADALTLLAADPTTLQSRLDRVTALSARLGLRLNTAKCRSLHLSGRHLVGTRPTSFTVGGDAIPALGDFEEHNFLGRPVGFRVLPDETTVDEAVHLGRKLLSSMLAPWQRLDAIKTYLYPALNFAMRAGSAGIPFAAELSDICRVDGAFKLLTSTDVKVRERAAGDLEGSVSRRLRRPANTEDMEAYLSGEREGDILLTSTQVQSVWTEARKASRRLSIAWELLEHRARINCGEASVSARNRHKLVKTIRALLSIERDRALHDKPNQGKAMIAAPGREDFSKSRYRHPGGHVGTTADLQGKHKRPSTSINPPVRRPARTELLLPSRGATRWASPAPAERPMITGASVPASAPCRAAGQHQFYRGASTSC